MTSALIPLAASSILALSSGAPHGQAAPQAGGPAPAQQVAQAPRGGGPAASVRAPSAARAAVNQGASRGRAAPTSGSHARTPPDRSASSQSGGGSSQASAHGAPPRHASSNAVQAHPSRAPRHASPAARPAPHRYGPWSPAPHRAYVIRHHHVTPWHPRYWTAGVFVYEAPPARPAVAGRPAVAKTAAPAREIDRSHSLSLGVRSGSYMSGYYDEANYGDLGFGLAARYRGSEALGVEVAYGYFSDDFTPDTERVTQPLSASVQLFAFPWTRVSPYLSGGATWTARSYDDSFSNGLTQESFQTKDLQFGPHAGVGLELAVGEKSSLSLEGRYTHFVTHDEDDDISTPGNLQGLIGVNVYF